MANRNPASNGVQIPRPAANSVESFDSQSCPEGRLAIEKSPYLNELEPQFKTRTFTFPILGFVVARRTKLPCTTFLAAVHLFPRYMVLMQLFYSANSEF